MGMNVEFKLEPNKETLPNLSNFGLHSFQIYPIFKE